MRFTRLALLAPLLAAFCMAQQTINNDSIIRMAKAGISDSLIITTINAQPGQYDTSADGIIALKNAGVSETVIAALLTRTSAPAPPSSPADSVDPLLRGLIGRGGAASTAADADDPSSPHEPGIYLVCGSGAAAKMVEVAPSSLTRSALGGSWAHIAGSRASARCASGSLTLYFFFPSAENGGRGSGSVLGDASSADEFALLKLGVRSKNRQLLLALNSFLTWVPHLKDKIPVTVVRLRAGVYKVSPASALAPGEYGIFALQTMIQSPFSTPINKVDNQVFDFGVD